MGYDLTEKKIEFILDLIRPYIQTEKALKDNLKIVLALFNNHKVETSETKEKAWNVPEANWLISTLTLFQRQIVDHLVKNGESKLDDLVKELQKKTPSAGRITVGGACAGLHRKCNQRQLPHLISQRQGDNDEWLYSIIPQALPFFKLGLKPQASPIGFSNKSSNKLN